jgi:multisubunit Na+/H+ antiporter MnhF subunit
MNAWLVAAMALLVGMLPLGAATLRRAPLDGLPALQVAGVNASLILAMLAVGLDSRDFFDLALVLALLNFAGTLAFATLLERRD